ncbi:hypothetical protein BDQ17DRAFT_1426783 [Cyathus striatus]|nr:hypothetical protein BDQ17DRAFT_1426783 [Cyathus striatus]
MSDFTDHTRFPLSSCIHIGQQNSSSIPPNLHQPYTIPPNPYIYMPYVHSQQDYRSHHPFNDPLVVSSSFITLEKHQRTAIDSTGSVSKRARIGNQENVPSYSIEGDTRQLAPQKTTVVSPLQMEGISKNTVRSEDFIGANYGSIISDAWVGDPVTKVKTVSDVWFFIIPVSSKDKADIVEIPKDIELSKTCPRDAAFIACRLCKGNNHSVWKRAEGQTSAICTHLHEKHWKVYSETITKEKLKGLEDIVCNAGKRFQSVHTGVRFDCEQFTLDGFYTRLARWIVVDGQSMNTVEFPEQRDLLLFLSADITENDIPHRTKVADLIRE